MSERKLSATEYAAALARGQKEANTEIRARAAQYLPLRDVLKIDTRSGACFLIPRSFIQALQGIAVAELFELVLWPDGAVIELKARDIQISVAGLLQAAFH